MSNAIRSDEYKSRFSSLLSPNTILGRFIFTATILIVATIIVAWLAQSQANKISHQNIANQSERIAVAHTLREITDQLWQIETQFQSYMLVPDDLKREKVLRHFDHIESTTFTLEREPWIIRQSSATSEIRIWKSTTSTLRQLVENIMTVRADPQQVFPNMRVMVNELVPRHNEFSVIAHNAIIEDDHESQSLEQHEIEELFYELNIAWLHKINVYRIFVTTRSGTFNSSVKSGLKNAVSNIDLYDVQVEKLLATLKEHEKSGDLSLNQSAALEDLIRLRSEWNHYFHTVKSIVMDDNRWRVDVPVLSNQINPLFLNLWQIIQNITDQLDRHSADTIGQTERTTDNVSASLWVLTFVVVVVTVLGGYIFEVQIRRPIMRVVTALNEEAAGHQIVSLPEKSVAEARYLADAFGKMREQIQIRQQQIQLREQRLRSILDNTAEGIITFNDNCIIETWNHAAELLFRCEQSKAIGAHLRKYITFDQKEGGSDEAKNRRDEKLEIIPLIGRETEVLGVTENGDHFPLSLKISRMNIEGALKYTAVLSNITERKAMVENLRHMAEHDDLTGLHNRTYFHSKLAQTVDEVSRGVANPAALFYIDLDNFKYVNDIMGHAAGDKLLVEVSNILNLRARRSDLVARLGGDEFVVLLTEINSDTIRATADSFRRYLADYSFSFDGRAATIGCSIGVAPIDSSCANPSEIMSRADIACHLAKRSGRNRVHIFSENDAGNVSTMSLDMSWSRRIKIALEQDKFVLALQPVVTTPDKSGRTFEVLVRMRDDDGTIIMPSGFLATAERFGMAADIDEWVVRHAILQLAELRERKLDIRFSINLSGQSFSSPLIAESILRLIRETALDPSAITFEITETAAIADIPAAVDLLSRLRAIGCGTALDDFGSGMSSFGYLRELPVDTVKIDGRFVKNVVNNPVDLAMLKAMNDIAHALGKQTVAEFVENESHFELICEIGVDYGQGYFLGKPALLETWIDLWKSDTQ